VREETESRVGSRSRGYALPRTGPVRACRSLAGRAEPPGGRTQQPRHGLVKWAGLARARSQPGRAVLGPGQKKRASCRATVLWAACSSIIMDGRLTTQYYFKRGQPFGCIEYCTEPFSLSLSVSSRRTAERGLSDLFRFRWVGGAPR
jgi:hypothetical protein